MNSGCYVVDENGKRVAILRDIKYYEVVGELKRNEDELAPFDQVLREIGEGRVAKDDA
jgi:hypothetical protein